ncbi:hypothetical protein DFH06DRAFT_1239366, partial [Mycena polygramma]
MVMARLLLPMGCEIRLSWFLSGSLVPSAFAALMATTDRHRISAHGLFFLGRKQPTISCKSVPLQPIIFGLLFTTHQI